MVRIILSLLLFAEASFAAEKICVRSFPIDEVNSPCHRFPESYTFAARHKAQDETGICTRVYGETYCELSPKEYRRVHTVDGGTICTLHFNQPGVANLCASLKDFYDWAEGAE